MLFGVEVGLWFTAAKKWGKWYWGFVEAADRFMVIWYEQEVERGWLRHTTDNDKSEGCLLYTSPSPRDS